MLMSAQQMVSLDDIITKSYPAPTKCSVMGCKRPSRDFIHHNNIKSYFFAQVKGANVQDFDY